MSSLPKMPEAALHSIELTMLLILLALMSLRLTYTRPRSWSLARRVTLIVLIIAGMINNIIVLATQENVIYSHFLRPIVFVILIRPVRQ
jgi:hypothetical protein